jgi:hypothetical protein
MIRNRKQTTDVLTAAFVLLCVLWGGQVFSDILSAGGCESEGLPKIQSALIDATEKGRVMLPRSREALIGLGIDPHDLPVSSTCGVYQWATKSGTGIYPLVWCERPHGIITRWRNVLFSDLSLERVPEAKFPRMVAKSR